MTSKWFPPRRAAALLVLATAWTAATGPALAQNSQVQELLNRVERMQTELTTLQRQVYRGAPPPAAAARPAGDDGTAQSRKLAARMSVRITQLEDELRRLTGKTEEFAHAISQMRERIEKLASDLEVRLAALERGETVATTPPPAPGTPPDATAALQGRAVALAPPPGTVPAPPPPRGAAAPGLAPGPQTLGTIRAVDLPPAGAPKAAAAAPAPATPPKMTPKEQYDLAHALIIKQQNFEEAERVLKSFIESYPDDELAPNAHYWLGRTYFVRNDFQRAAFTFAEGFQKFPKSDKAPDNLLNLGMSLARLDQKKEACTAFSRLLKNFPKVDGNVKRRVAREQRRLHCG